MDRSSRHEIFIEHTIEKHLCFSHRMGEKIFAKKVTDKGLISNIQTVPVVLYFKKINAEPQNRVR